MTFPKVLFLKIVILVAIIFLSSTLKNLYCVEVPFNFIFVFNVFGRTVYAQIFLKSEILGNC